MFPLFVHLECEDFKDGVAKAKENLLAEGAGHSSIVYTDNKELIEYAGVELPVSRLLVDQPGMGCANAFLNNGLMPTSTLGCGSWSGCSISENLGPGASDQYLSYRFMSFLKTKFLLTTKSGMAMQHLVRPWFPSTNR